MVTGWLQLGYTWYYLLPSSGEMVTGWKYIGTSWYYFESNGAMVTGWKQIDNKWYYLEPTGQMVTGWKFIGSFWYYFNSSGVMQTGWLNVNNNDYYLNELGQMLTGWQLLVREGYNKRNGIYKEYYNYFNSSGELVTDSDKKGDSGGNNTYQNYKNLNAGNLSIINLSYYTDCCFHSEFITDYAANTWNALPNCHSSFSQESYAFYADIRVYDSDNLDDSKNAVTYFYYSSNVISPGTSNWDLNMIYINTNNDVEAPTMMHEFGHTLGLSHRITNKYSIMYYTDRRMVTLF